MNAFADIVREAHVAENPPVPRERPEVEEETTPSGIQIRYEDKRHLYYLNDARVPSVSTVLGCLDKPALPWWGMTIGVKGVLALQEQGALPPICDHEDVVKLLTEHKLTVNHVRDRAADRGVTVHDALEAYCRHAEIPNPALWPESQRGYVEALLAFLEDVELVPVAMEVMVGSLEHGFAGRYDLRCVISGDNVRVKADKKNPDKDVWAALPVGRRLLDAKTSTGVYLEHFLQLEGYEGASVECGYEATVERMVLHLLADGRYELVTSRASYDQFLAVLACHSALAALKERAA